MVHVDHLLPSCKNDEMFFNDAPECNDVIDDMTAAVQADPLSRQLSRKTKPTHHLIQEL